MKYCKSCGKEINDNADVCIYCKTPVKKDMYEKPKKEGNSMGWICFFVLIIIAVLVGVYFYAEMSFYNNLFDF